jgi:hypothetical protein
MEMEDETEFYFAEKYFGGYPHWKRLLQASWFLDYFTDIREELKIKQIADARSRIKKVSQNPESRSALQANKLILEEFKKGAPVGRPTKESVRLEANRLFIEADEISDDLDRITSALNSGS